MASLGTLSVTLGVNTREFNRQMNRAQTRLRGISSQMRSGINTAGRYGAAASAAGAAIGTVLVTNALRGAREVRNLSEVSNANIEVFQRQAYAARTVGIEQEKYADILKDMNDRVGDFLSTGAGPMADFFENVAPKVGVTAEQFRNLSGPEALQLYVDSLQQANLSQSEMTFYLEAMASDATALIPLLRNNGELMRKLGDEAERTGNVLSRVDIEQMIRAEEAIERAGMAVDGLTRRISAELAPYIEAAADEFVSAAEQSQGFGEIAIDALERVMQGVGVLADGIHGIRVILKGVLLAFQSVGTGILGVFSMITEGWARIISGVLDGIETIANAMNQIPGIDIDTSGLARLRRDFDATAESTRLARERMIESTEQTKDELHELLMQPLPSSQIEATFERIRASAEEARRKIEETMASGGGDAPAGGGQGRPESAEEKRRREEEERRREAMQERVRRIQESLMTERELEVNHHEQRMKFLEEARTQELEMNVEWDELMREEKQRHQSRLREIQLRGERSLLADHRQFLISMEQLQKTSGKAQVSTVAGAFEQISAAGARHNKELFRVNQIAGIANATISTYTGAAKALELPFPLNIAAAATVIANGMAKVAAIKSQSFSASAAGGADAAPSVNASSPSTPVSPTGGGGGGQVITLDMRGGNDNSRQSIRDLVEQLDEFIRDGGQIAGITTR